MIIVHGIIIIREKLTSRSCIMQLKKVWMKHQGINNWYVYIGSNHYYSSACLVIQVNWLLEPKSR